MDVLDAIFRRAGTGWELRSVPRCAGMEATEWRGWVPPRAEQLERQLLASLFDTDASRRLLKRPWHLRLRPEQLSLDSAGIPPVNWTYLVHPDSRCHVLDLEWTVTELVEPPTPGCASGEVVVVGGSELAGELRRRVGPFVREGAGDALPPESIVVVQGRGLDDEAARQLEARAWRQRCPLLIWCDYEPPRTGLPSIFIPRSSPAPAEPEVQWLTRLLIRLVRGVEPVVAFAEAGSGGPPRDRFARWMRGAHDGWTIRGDEPELILPRHWYVSLDRSKQEGQINNLVDGLLRARTRRIALVVAPGPEGAGLDWFRHRRPRIDSSQRIIEWDVGWAENPAHTIRLLQRKVNASRVGDIGYRLQELAARHEGGALFWIRHETVSLQPRDDATEVTLAELAAYSVALRDLAAQLATTTVRALLHLSVVGATKDDLLELKSHTPHFLCDVLPTLELGVPRDELEGWLIAHDMPFDDEDLTAMQHLPYEQLIERIAHRYPQLVGA